MDADTDAARARLHDVAIIGAGLRVPGADDLDSLWSLVRSGRSQWAEFPRDRLLGAGRDSALAESVRGAFVAGATDFDAAFFGISSREALAMDPQQRMLLECVWHAVEDAGLGPQRLWKTNTAVFVGASGFDYYELLLKTDAARSTHIGTGLSHAVLANRVSQYFGLTGASEAIDSACASSMVALWRGVEALRRGDSELALVAGVNLLASATTFGLFADAGMLSPSGRCRPFDDAADGYVRGEGVLCAVLKPLAAALADGDRVLGVIKGGAVRHSGRTQSLTAPNPQAQADVIKAALRDAGAAPASIGYVEAHGTGTPLGDPVEVRGLKQAYAGPPGQADAPAAPHLYLGSIKAQIGHLEAAAGLAGVFKALTVLQHGVVPACGQVTALNRFIDLTDAPMRLPAQARAWDDADGEAILPAGPRRAGVSSFGFGGTNSHLVLEQAPAPPPRAAAAAAAAPRLFVLSAKTLPALSRVCARLAEHLDNQASADAWLLDDVAYSLRRRAALPVRLALVASTRDELAQALRRYATSAELAPGAAAGTAARKADRDAAAEPDTVTAWRGLVERGELASLGASWAQGAAVPWEQVVPRTAERLVALPGYPFVRERCWPGDAQRPTAAAGDASAACAVYYAPEWEAAALDPARRSPCVGAVRVLVAGRRGRRVVQAFAALVGPATPVETIEAVDASTQVLLDAETAAPFAPGTAAFVDLTALDAAGYHALGVPRKLAWLSKRLGGALRRGEALRVVQLTCDLQRPMPAPPAAPPDALPAGARDATFYEHLGAEYKRCRSKTVDLGDAAADADDEAAARCMVDELEQLDGECLLAYRDGQRRARRMRPLALPAAAASGADSVGAALITGGTGAIGLRLAQDLTARGCRALLLTGRRALAGEGLAAVEALRAAGACVALYDGELTDAASLGAALDAFSRRHGAITHVFHCAGAVDHDTPAFVQKTQASIERVARPKTDALEVLHTLFAPRPPQAFVLFSSASAAAPALAAGVLDYAASNGFLDLYAQHQRAHGRRDVLSIQWTRWDGLGMASGARAATARGLPLSPAACLAALHTLLAAAHAPGVPASVCVLAAGDAAFEPEAAALPAPVAAVAAPAAPPAAPRAPSPAGGVLQRVRSLVARELEMDASRLDDEATFEALGIDSIILVGLIDALEQWLGQVVEPQNLIQCDSIAAVARYVERLQGPAAGVADGGEHPPRAAAPAPTAAPALAAAAAAGAAPAPFPVAVIGIACRFPGAANAQAFWHNLAHGVDSVGPVPASRWDRSALYSDRLAAGRSISQWGGFVDDIESITPRLFGMSAGDAADVDPLIRLFTECSLLAAADGPLGREGLAGRRVGVFVGARAGHYGARIAQPGKHSVTGIGQNFIASYVSHLLDLRGPSMVLDTACSSSLTAIHLACQSLRSGETELALAGGVEVLLDEKPYLFLSASGALSPRGRCRAFDAKADGFVPGEGAGCVLLKPLHQALADGDPVYAVIAGSAMNNDGHTLGITTPGVAGQVDVIEQALRAAQVPARAISYVEAHGTGTLIGDPIELQALARAFQTDPPERCGVGSVKSNVGHLLSAAGVASFIKVALALHQRVLPPTLHVEQPNPRFDFERTPFFPVREARAWDAAPSGNGAARHAGISAFGFGKTNVHMILTEAPAAATRAVLRPPLPVAEPGPRLRAWHAAGPALRAAASPPLLALSELVVEEETGA